MGRSFAGWALLGVLLSGCVSSLQDPPGPGPEDGAGLGPFPAGTPPGTSRVFARVSDPGFPEGIVVHGDRVYFTASADDAPVAKVLVHALRSGALLREISLDKPCGSPACQPPVGSAVVGGHSRFLGMQADAHGRLYVADTQAGRLLRLDLAQAPPAVTTYATFPDLPACTTSLPGTPCSPTAEDLPPFPDYLVFGPRGEAYVSDFIQATLFRVPPGGGDPEVWFQDARFGTTGPNGLALDADDAHLYVAQTGLTDLATALPGPPGPGGAVLRLPTSEAPGPADLEVFHLYPGRWVDGLAFGASGRLYVTLIGLGEGADGISVLDPDGAEVAFHSTPATGPGGPLPWDFPASVAFHPDHRSLLVTNQGLRAREHWAVLETFVDDTALPLHGPPG